MRFMLRLTEMATAMPANSHRRAKVKDVVGRKDAVKRVAASRERVLAKWIHFHTLHAARGLS
jgi:hypothetical protein